MLADGPPRQVFREHAPELDEYGIWIPQVTELALAHGWPGELPLTVAEARRLGIALSASAGRSQTPVAKRQEGPPAAVAESRLLNYSAPGSLATNGPGSGPRTMPALAVSQLTFAYPGGPPVLRDVTLEVSAGDFAALVGPNGSGKSTLAGLATGVRLPPRGTVRLFGRDVRDLSAADIADRAGYVFQNPEHQFVADTVADELAYSLRARRRPEAAVDRVIHDLIERFGLAGLEAANPFTLSHGQKRRLSVATMLAAGQQMLVLDEPTFGQDRRGAQALMNLLSELNRRGVTLIMITHDMRLVADHARSVVVLIEGQVVFTGTPAALFEDSQLLARARLLPPPLVELGIMK
jgi:energy-coupling factor transport system ATP-binding protein